jgi:uncharacterized protein (TIGR03118 family)
MSIARRSACVSSLALVAAVALWWSAPAEAQQYKRTDLVSDLAGATFQDANLVNPWGLSRSSTSPWWAADNGTGLSTLYDGTGKAQALVVTIPPAAGGTTGVPTGTVFNGTTDFKLPNGNPARFLFVAEDGTISGWNSGTQAIVVSTNPDAVYKGAAIATRDGAHYLYVANFSQRRIDVFDTSFHRVRSGHGEHDSSGDSFEERHGDSSRDSFRDERLPRGYSPFNVQNIGGSLYVAFAKLEPGGTDEVQGAGLGYVDVFSPSGRLLRRFEHGPWLNAPWGLALAPGDFGAFSHNLLVGQFGSGEIAVYDVASGRFVGKMQDAASAVLSIDGLWALSFGGGGTNSGPLNTLYFTAGIQDEQHGIFGSLTSVSAAPLGNGQ